MERVQVSKAATTVTVACKLPNGLWLQLYQMGKEIEATPAGTREVPKSVKIGDPIKIAGCALPFGQAPEIPMPGGYALTQVPADFWAKWLHDNADADVVKNRLIFAADSMDKTADRAREQHKEKVRSGMEPIDPKAPPRVGMKVTPAAVPQ